jgi:ribose-phosphate pyrophosphokinase
MYKCWKIDIFSFLYQTSDKEKRKIGCNFLAMSESVKKEWIVAPGPASKDLSLKIAERMGSKILDIETKLFADGESYHRIINNVFMKRIALIQSTYPPIDRHIMQLLFLAHKLSEEGAEVYAILPYLAYARQHRMFLDGEVTTLGVFAHLLKYVGVKRVLTIDIHSIEGLGLFPMPIYSASAISRLAEYIKSRYNTQNLIAASPDLGGSPRVESFAHLMGIECFSCSKTRDKKTGEVTIDNIEKIVCGKDIVLVDDIISSGKTIEKATIKLKESGAARVIASCVHPLLTEGALERTRKAGVEELIGSNTIPSSISKVDVSEIITSYLSSI